MMEPSSKPAQALRQAESLNIDDDSDGNDLGASITAIAAASSNSITSMTSSSIVNCDSRDLFCPVGTCYTGVNGYLGCCTVSSCAARTTCIPYHAGQKSCNEDTEGCVFCSNPATPYCFRFENWETEPSAFAMWCTSSPGTTIVFYTNPISYQSTAGLPLAIFTPSWSSSASSSSSTSIITSLTSTDRGVAASATSAAATVLAAQSTSTDAASYPTENLTTGDIAGIAIGSSVVLFSIVALLAYLLYKKRKNIDAQQITVEQPRGTLGGAVLPGSWLSGNGVMSPDDIAGGPSRRLTSTDTHTGVESPARNSAGQELGDTAIAPYSIELGDTTSHIPDPTFSSAHFQQADVRPSHIPYSPMNVILATSPYANRRASYSDPGIAANHEASRSSEVYRDVDGQAWVQGNQTAQDIQASTRKTREELTPLISEQIQTSAISQSVYESPLSIQSNEFISPISTESSPSMPSFQQRVSSLQQDSPNSNADVIARYSQSTDPLLAHGHLHRISRDHSQNQIQFPINQSTPLSSHPSSGRISADIQHLLEATPVSEDEMEGSAPDQGVSSATNISSEHGQSSGRRAVRTMSARGSWSGWISPESAYTDGFWDTQSIGTETGKDNVDKPEPSGKKQN